jgi:hypothetical protein
VCHVSLPSSYRSRRGHIHLPQVLPLVGCRSKTPIERAHVGLRVRVALVQHSGGGIGGLRTGCGGCARAFFWKNVC